MKSVNITLLFSLRGLLKFRLSLIDFKAVHLVPSCVTALLKGNLESLVKLGKSVST